MALTLNFEKEFSLRSARVKSLDLHPSEPWALAGLHSGNVFIWNYQAQTVVKSIEVTNQPIRTAKFIARNKWIVTGADDGLIRVYSYDTMEKVKELEAHTDFIRSTAVHPTLSYLLSSSDDQLIKLWDWDKDWACSQVFEGHNHYVMHVGFNPKDLETFASASLDGAIKMWSLGSPTPTATFDGHSKGVNCVDFFSGGDKPYIISGSDDYTAKVWDYETTRCVETLEGHSNNVTAVWAHPELPLIMTGSEDATIRAWNAVTFKPENTLDYEFGRAWALEFIKDSRRLLVGYDEGLIMVKINCPENLRGDEEN